MARGYAQPAKRYGKGGYCFECGGKYFKNLDDHKWLVHRRPRKEGEDVERRPEKR